MKQQTTYIIAIALALVWSSCSDLLEVPLPENQITAEEAVTNVEELQELSNSNYDVFANGFNGLGQRMAALLADDVFVEGNSGFLIQVYNRGSDFFNGDVGGFYREPYFAIRRANAILDQLEISDFEMTEAERNRFEGESRFMRAVCHWEIARLFAQPFGYTADNSHPGIVLSESNSFEFSTPPRSSVNDVYQYVISELEQAESLLPAENDIYATTWAAKAYLAKVYFQMNDFQNAYAYAQDVIQNGPYAFDLNINNRYSQDISSEAIFYTVSVSAADNRAATFTSPGMYFSANDVVPFMRASEEVGLLLTQDTSDLRSAWVELREIGANEQYVYTKYNLDYMNVVHTSLTEIMLIAAESAGQLNTNLEVAIGYINQIKERAGISPLIPATSGIGVIQAAREERRKEFCGDGMRVHDLKRRGVLGEAITIRDAPWDCNGMVLQFPASEITVENFELNPEGGCN